MIRLRVTINGVNGQVSAHKERLNDVRGNGGRGTSYGSERRHAAPDSTHKCK